MSNVLKLLLVTLAYSIAGAVGSAALGATITASVWAWRTPDGAARAVQWGVRQGLLIGAMGLITGAIVGLVGTQVLTPRAASVRGVLVGLVMGSLLALAIMNEAAGGPVAVAAILAHATVGLLLGLASTKLRKPRLSPPGSS